MENEAKNIADCSPLLLGLVIKYPVVTGIPFTDELLSFPSRTTSLIGKLSWANMIVASPSFPSTWSRSPFSSRKVPMADLRSVVSGSMESNSASVSSRDETG